MRAYKIRILPLLIFAIVSFSYNQRLFAISIISFKQKDTKSQAELINSMSKQEKFRFFKKFLPGSCFYEPPNTLIKFFSDGSALNNDQRYFYTHWNITNNRFNLWQEEQSDPYPEDKIEYVLTDFTAEGGSDGLWITITNSKDEGINYRYDPECGGYFQNGSSLYENYKKTLTPQERARLEKLNPPVKPSAIVDDKQSTISEYAGIYGFGGGYGFGVLENQWDLFIVVVDGQAYAQSKGLHFSSDDGKSGEECHIFEGVEIRGNKLTAKTLTGRFVVVTIEGKNKKGLSVSLKHDGKDELGKKYSVSLREYLNGKYPETYLKRLDERDLANKTKQELKIMRNEIYARYGYQFRPNGSMDKYFRSQFWYEPRDGDVSNCISDIEKENIKFIQAHE